MENETRPPNHRQNTLEAATHIMEHSQAETKVKINAAIVGLYPEDLAHVEKAVLQVINTLKQKT